MTPSSLTPKTWLAAARGLPRPAKVAIGLFFLAGFADGMLVPFFALWAQREAGVPTEYIGLLLGCYAGGELLATPLVGGIADRLGRRPVLLVSMAGIGCGFLALFFARGPIPVGLALLATGAFESVLHPTIATVIADVAQPGSLRRQFALTRVASGAGRMAGPLLGAGLAAWSLGLVFLGSAAAMLAGAALSAMLLPETITASPTASDDDDDDIAALLTVFRDPRLAALLLPVTLMGLAASWIETVLPLYAADAGTLGPAGIGLLFTGAGAVSVVFQLPVTAWSTRLTGFAAAVASGGLLVLAFGSLLAGAALPLLAAAVVLVKFAEMLAGPLVQTIVAELAPRAARATYMAAFSVVQDLEDAAGPAIGTALFAVAASLPWLIGAPLALASAVALALAADRHERAAGGRPGGQAEAGPVGMSLNCLEGALPAVAEVGQSAPQSGSGNSGDGHDLDR